MTDLEFGRLAEKVDTTARDVAKLWTEHRVLSAVVQGPDGTNGIKSEVGALKEWRGKHTEDSTKLRQDLAHYFDVERIETCHGLVALAKYGSEQEKVKEEEIVVKTTKMKEWVSSQGQWLQLLGVIIMALVMIFKK